MSNSLRGNSLSFVESMVMGIAGSAPASSVALGTAVLIGTAGHFAPVSLLVFAIPMLGIARAYQALGERDGNAGASYRWTSAVMGRLPGFMSGWALLAATLIFMVSGSVPIATATLNFIAPQFVGNVVITAAIASAWFAIIALVVMRGIIVTSRAQLVITTAQLLILIVILVIAANHVRQVGAVNDFDWRWLGKGLSPDSLSASALLAVYFYWGWDVTSNLGEETSGGGGNAGLGGLVSIFITIVLYAGFAAIALLVMSINDAQHATDNLIFDIAARAGLGRQGGLLASAAVILSSVAALEATMLMFSRTLFAMGRDGSMPLRFGEVSEKSQSPTNAILVIVVLGLVLIWGSAFMPSVEMILSTSVKALGLQVDYYFGLAGISAAWLFRHTYRDSLMTWISLCVFPALSSFVLIGLGLYAITTFDITTNIVGIGGFAVGLIFYRSRPYGQTRSSAELSLE